MSSHLAVIVNPSSGASNNQDLQNRLTKSLSAARDSEVRILLAGSGEEISELAERAVAEGANPVVAGGGDGTLNAVASVLVGTERTLGVLPLGTLNHFAKDLNIPLDVEGAVHTLIEGTVAQVDVGEVNGRIFLNNSGLGLYPHIVRHREKLQDRLGHGKWPAFLWAVLSVLRRYPFLTVRVSTDEQAFVRRTPFVFIGNNEYVIDGLNVGGRKRLDSGHLCLYTAHRTGRVGLLRFALRALLGRLHDEKDFDALCTQEVFIETKRTRVHVATDGEVTVMRTPLYYRIRPGALRVLVPRSAESVQNAG